MSTRPFYHFKRRGWRAAFRMVGNGVWALSEQLFHEMFRLLMHIFLCEKNYRNLPLAQSAAKQRWDARDDSQTWCIFNIWLCGSIYCQESVNKVVDTKFSLQFRQQLKLSISCVWMLFSRLFTTIPTQHFGFVMRGMFVLPITFLEYRVFTFDFSPLSLRKSSCFGEGMVFSHNKRTCVTTDLLSQMLIKTCFQTSSHCAFCVN